MVEKSIHTSASRKTAVARTTLKQGSGSLSVNSFDSSQLSNPIMREKIFEPLTLAGPIAQKVSITVRVHGGGQMGQAEAARTAIARALIAFDSSLQSVFMEYDRTLLVSDVRRKETHKPNRHGKARAKVQKSYR